MSTKKLDSLFFGNISASTWLNSKSKVVFKTTGSEKFKTVLTFEVEAEIIEVKDKMQLSFESPQDVKLSFESPEE